MKVIDHTNDNTAPVGSRKEGEDKLEQFKGELELELVNDGETLATNYQNGHEHAPVEVVEETKGQPPEVSEESPETPATGAQDIALKDPEAMLPGWMLSEIDHGNNVGIDLNKNGTQVVAGALGLEVSGEHTVKAHETDFEYSRYEATVKRPDGRIYTAVGDCHIDEKGKDKWDLDRMSETRGKKRAVKWATAGGIEALKGDN